MHVRKALLLAAIGMLVSSSEPVAACGDKFLIVGRGSRFQRAYVAAHPASLLVVNSNVTGQRDLQTSLKLAGHGVRVAAPSEVAATYASGRYDFVLADVRDSEAVGHSLPPGIAESRVLPVVDASSRVAVAEAEKQFKCLLGHGRSMKESRHFLAEIDAAMDTKLKAAPLHCDVK